MTITRTLRGPVDGLLRRAVGRREDASGEAAERRRELAGLESFTTHADLLELAAILDRYPDEVSEPIRRSLTWQALA
ncbi:MAG TPA: hypothetical protein VMI11_11410 [Actinomycetes bacterium]|nr:hypothetical protein [Actinomycetes bacterium]